MIIKITEINRNAKLGTYDAVEVRGTKLDGRDWFRKYFADNQELNDQLGYFGVGETINVGLEQKGKNWNIISFGEATQKEIDAELKKQEEYKNRGTSHGSSTGATSSGSSGKGSSLSKAEWAEKDRVTAISIAKAVGIKAAARAGKTTAKSMIKLADELLPYLLDTSPFTSDNDPLDPPK
jgi:hypothetical protein